MPSLYVQRDFHVYVAPEGEGEKETRKEFRRGARIECTDEQAEVGRDAGVLGDTKPKDEPSDAPTNELQEE